MSIKKGENGSWFFLVLVGFSSSTSVKKREPCRCHLCVPLEGISGSSSHSAQMSRFSSSDKASSKSEPSEDGHKT